MPNLRGKTWTTTTPANVGDAQYWEDHLISDADATKIGTAVQTVNGTPADASGNVDVVALPAGGTAGQVLTKLSSTAGDADWEDPASSGHTIQNASGTDMAQQDTLQFLNAEVTNDSVNGKTVVNCNGQKGDKGDKGDTGDTPNITVTSTTDNISSVNPSINVVKSGTTAAPIFDFQFSGFKGAQGDPGSAGPSGAAATITVGTVTTLPSGSNATVTNVGSTSAAVFDFGIPKGADGSGSISDAFKTVKVGSTSIVAHEADTLKFIPGTNIEMAVDSTSKSITLTATYPAVDVPDVINNLTSTSTTDALSAYQGNLLNAAVLLKANDADLKAVAKSGDYNDLSNKPTIPAAQIQSDWNQTSTSSLDFIKNKPTIPAAQIQSDWNQTSTSALDFIKNKPTQLGHTMRPDPTSNPDEDDVVTWVKGASSTNDQVPSLYGVQNWSNAEITTLIAHISKDDDTVGVWNDTWETDGIKTGWVWHECLYHTIPDNEVEISIDFDIGGKEVVVLYAYRVDDEVYNAVTSPSGNPQAQGWYELSGSTYVLTTDTSVVGGKTYYIGGGAIAIKLTSPIQNALGVDVAINLKRQRTNLVTSPTILS